ncbi:ubiquinone biosynthesis hydroxylase [Pinisolibacter aquiterrae]|uniref:ubiquinone biosynthesis hydroxylase n=1 Tax=Pinisolibacter aquiterrae TaxID=2815579 RepID=UPI001C3CE1E7|nr:ubiquinone biosynthesis hydroxylase [Pinisolibacter aquiterrae]MBV5266236.1 ubiquinone biosynthesis hydroxylase [Pinisolibacter aquiterrae]MCC8236324.1 ubiquinone biosynthesis hydroxylase [Pinisolibacter aquiterrae]
MPFDFDVIIAGGGHVGASLALALKRGDPHLRVAMIDPAPVHAGVDLRASAIAAAARRFYESLEVWAPMAVEAQPIVDMVVTDSRLDDAVRPVFLTFDAALDTGEPFAHMVPNGVMVRALVDACRAAGVDLLMPERVVDFTTGETSVTVGLGSGRSVTAGLLVAADGVRSRLRDLAGIGVVKWDYGQSGIVTTVAHERPHEGRAVEHFLPSGPFAILPLIDDADGRHRSSLVWTEKSATADRLVAGDDFTFALELERRFGRQLGRIEVLAPPKAFPLGLTLARDWVRPRFALVGDAAHGIHPIAGQGLNIGLRDVATLAETIVDARRLGLDPGGLDVLSGYERRRRFDAFEMGVVTDVLNRLFSNDLPPIRALRDVGLGLVDRLGALKRRFIREAAGIDGAIPRAMRGERP